MRTRTLNIKAIDTIPKIDIKSVICTGCNLVHLLDKNGKCEFCRRGPARPRFGVLRTLAGTVWETLSGTGQGLFVKDREKRPLPPSVISD